MEKYALLKDQILHEGIVSESNFFEPTTMSEETILLAHDPNYWRRTLHGEWTRQEERRSGFPWSAAMVERERVIMQGTLDCAKKALDSGTVAMNIAGGTHHAYADRAEGFCILNDFALASKWLLHAQKLKRVLIVDCDVHQGDGTAALTAGREDIFTLSMHAEKNFPVRKARSTLDIALPDGTGDDAYLSTLEAHLPRVLDEFGPDVVLYQAGVDPHANDKLGRLALSDEGLQRRDSYVVSEARRRGLPIASALGGGYGTEPRLVAERHARSMIAMAQENAHYGDASQK
ncbi:MAG TPA: histone deacetylase [Flavobacteriales bacterium]|nr:histone deacetylase [Flavobacteriales bacterium]